MAAALETRARIIFRDALLAHYIMGIDGGNELEWWLKTHRGWFPDSQELYGDGTPLTQPVDEGDSVMSAYPDRAVREAKPIMNHLVHGNCEAVCPELIEPAHEWLKDERRSTPISSAAQQDRSRSPRSRPQPPP